MVDRFVGCLLGLASGDALGMPVEGFSAEEIKATVGPVRDMMPASEKHFHRGLLCGQYTDDTQQTLVLAESMLQSSGFSGDIFAERLMDWGLTWAMDESLNRGVGLATRSSLDEMRNGKPWQESGVQIPTCGSAMRAAPIGLVYHCDLSLVARYADLQSISTHCSSAARAGSVAVACGVALSLVGFPKDTVLRMVAAQAGRIDSDFSQRLIWAGSLMDIETSEALAQIGTSPSVYETVPAAFYCHLRFGPEDALIAGASCGGDTDTIASIAGALAGASEGTGWIPQRWLSCLEDRKTIEDMGKRLADLSARLCGERF
jgi:ADP-ribosyl-[dinitrogen reductase] hydrolase